MCQRQGDGPDSTENCGVPQVQYSDKVVDVRAVAVHRRLDVPVICSDAVLQLEVPQIQFIAGVRGHPSCNSDEYAFSVGDGDEWFFGLFGHFFRAPPGCPRVERQFSSLDDEEFFVIEGSHAN